MRFRALFATAASAVCLVALPALPANAAFHVAQDPYRDVEAVAETGNTTDSTTNKASVDINWLRLTHNNQLVFEFKLRDLKPNDQVGAYVKAVTPNGVVWTLRSVWQTGGNEFKLTRNDSNVARCADGISRKKDPTANVITLRIQRSCLNDPTSVKYGGVVAGFTSEGSVLVDDAFRNGQAPATPDDMKIGNVSVAYN